MSLWSLDELKTIGELDADFDLDIGSSITISGVCIDSRQVKKGDLFIALAGDPGPRFHGGVENPRDGHDFLPQAISGGAAAVLISDSANMVVSSKNVAAIKVSDTLDGLWALGSLARHRCPGQVVAITGSAGKTTAKSWLTQCLAEQFSVHSAQGSLNNHWGVPLSLSRMPRDTQVGVIEIGTNHSGEISPLSQMTRPNVAILLNVLPAHIGNFASFEALRLEKLSIADGLKEGGVVILPKSLADQNFNRSVEQLSFGFESDADISGSFDVREDGWHVRADVCGKIVEYQFQAGGEHRVLTSLAVLAAVHKLGGSLEQAAQCFSILTSPKGRGNKIQANGRLLIDDSYNSNPVSMKYALEALKKEPGRKIALLGEMLELGDEGAYYHQEIAKHFSDFDHVVTVGDGFSLYQGSEHYDQVEQIDVASLAAYLQVGDCVLIKGSNKVFWKSDFVGHLETAILARDAT